MAPQLVDQQVTTDEDVPVVFDVFTGGASNNATVTALPIAGHGVEIVEGSKLKLTPKANFFGTLTVTYSARNARGMATGHATVTVRSVNDAPTAEGGATTIGTHGKFDLKGSDVDGDLLTFEVVTPPAHGTLSGTPPTLSYTATPGFVGHDELQYVARDATARSAPATLSLDVFNVAPTASAASLTLDEDTSVAVTLSGHDDDDDPLTLTVVTPPVHGVLTGQPPALTYTPDHDYAGGDRLEFSASDGINRPSRAFIQLNITPRQDPPSATAQSVAAFDNANLPIILAGSDPDGDGLTFQIESFPAHGSLSGFGNSRSYRASQPLQGSDSFTFTVSDGFTRSAPATVAINVSHVNRPPTASSADRALDEDTASTFALSGSDPDGDAISFAVGASPVHGSVTVNGATATYTPAANFNGQDSFTFTTSDGAASSAPSTVFLTVRSVLDRPIPDAISVTTVEDTAIAIHLSGTDPDGRTMSFFAIPTSDGTVTGSGANVTYKPALNATGIHSFQFGISDGAFSVTGTVTVNITPVDDLPVAHDDYLEAVVNTPLPLPVLNNDIDVDGDRLAIDSVDAPQHGEIEMTDHGLVYTPNEGFTGEDVFNYTISEPAGPTSTAAIHVSVGSFPTSIPTETVIATGEAPENAPRFAPAISDNGRYLAFTSSRSLVADDTNVDDDVYVLDRGTRTVTLISRGDGVASNGSSSNPQISADGRFVAFESTASNLVTGDGNGASDVFRHDRTTGTTVRVSVATGGDQASGDSTDGKISDDGNLVAFTSRAFDLVANDTNGTADVFVHNIAAGTTTRVSASLIGGDGDLASSEPAISGDGRFVAFTSLATNLVASDSNGVADVFVRDLAAATTIRVSVATSGNQANAQSSGASLSRDGRFVGFISDANNLVPGVTFRGIAYVRDTGGLTTIASEVIPAEWSRLSADGRYLVHAEGTFAATVTLRDRIVGASSTLATARLWPVISGNGRYIALLDAAGNLIVIPNPR